MSSTSSREERRGPLLAQELSAGRAGGHRSVGLCQPGLPVRGGAQGVHPHVIQFKMDPALNAATLLGEPRELQSALSNLVSNAVRYTPAGGQIYVSVDHGIDGSLVMMVRDTGAGIAAEQHREHTPCRRVDTCRHHRPR